MRPLREPSIHTVEEHSRLYCPGLEHLGIAVQWTAESHRCDSTELNLLESRGKYKVPRLITRSWRGVGIHHRGRWRAVRAIPNLAARSRQSPAHSSSALVAVRSAQSPRLCNRNYTRNPLRPPPPPPRLRTSYAPRPNPRAFILYTNFVARRHAQSPPHNCARSGAVDCAALHANPKPRLFSLRNTLLDLGTFHLHSTIRTCTACKVRQVTSTRGHDLRTLSHHTVVKRARIRPGCRRHGARRSAGGRRARRAW